MVTKAENSEQPNTNPPQPIVFEAEAFDLDTYLIEENNFASNGALISLKGASGDTGTASKTFTGPSGLYDIVVGFFDELDGQGQLQFKVNDSLVDSWSLNQNLGSNLADEKSFQQRTISEIELATGDTLSILGTSDVTNSIGEFARVDFVQLLPLNGSDSGGFGEIIFNSEVGQTVFAEDNVNFNSTVNVNPISDPPVAALTDVNDDDFAGGFGDIIFNSEVGLAAFAEDNVNFNSTVNINIVSDPPVAALTGVNDDDSAGGFGNIIFNSEVGLAAFAEDNVNFNSTVNINGISELPVAAPTDVNDDDPLLNGHNGDGNFENINFNSELGLVVFALGNVNFNPDIVGDPLLNVHNGDGNFENINFNSEVGLAAFAEGNVNFNSDININF